MSTTVYGGIVFRHADLTRAFALLEQFAPRIAGLTDDALASFLADRACRKLDDVAAGATDDGRVPLLAAWDEIHDGLRAERREGARHPETDFEFRITLYPYGSRVYGMIRTERSGWQQILLDEHADELAEYAYWDNTDRPDGITAAEWRARKRTWEGIWLTRMKGRECGGCAVDLSSQLRAPEPEAVLAKLPEFSARIDRTARSRALAHFVKSGIGPDDGPDARIGLIMRAPAWFESEDGNRWVAAERERVAGLLLPEIGYDDLRGLRVSEERSEPRP